MYIYYIYVFELPFSRKLMVLSPAASYCQTHLIIVARMRVLDLTCRYHLNNIIPDGIFCDSM